jgi:hypothetical protein
MANNFPPTVTVFGANVELGDSVLLSQVFSVSDVDPGSVVTRFRFRDSSTDPESGFFTFAGVPVQQGVVIEKPWSDLSQVRYHAGSVIGGELISVEAFDGLFWSDPGIGTMYSVQPNVTDPVAEGTDFSVVAFETIGISQFVSASDPDGYPITEYMFVNRSQDINGGQLIFRGAAIPDAVWFPVAAEDLQFLEYRAARYGKAETISFIARDEASWSDVADFLATTTPNQFDPVIQAIETSVILGATIPASEMFVYSDLDPNTMKEVGFRDQGAAASSGYFTVNGVRQPAGQWFWVDAEDVGSVEFVSGSVISLEQFEVQAFDGQRLSRIGTADVSSVEIPTISTQPVQMIDSLEIVQLKSLIDITTGVSPLFYEVIDLNPAPTSATLVVNGVEMDGGEIHRISAVDFDGTFVRGGLDDLGRSLDEFVIRVDNGNHKSAWAGQTFSTDPVNQAALLDIGRWDNPNPPLELTFNFPLTIPEYFCTLGLDECTDFMPLTDPGMRAGIRDVLNTYELFFNMRFTEVEATVLSDMPFMLSDAVDAGAYTRSPGNPGIPGQPDPGADIFGVISNLPALMMSNPGEIGYETWIHEIGHAMGLDHPFSQPAGQAGAPPHLPPSIENNQFTVMSYTQAYFHPNTGVPVYAETPMLYDVMAIQTLYGANTSYRAGDTQIKFDRDFTNPQILYDASGFDTFNLNNHFINATIDLREGQFSSVAGLANNVGIAWGTVVENGRGGQGNDTIIGNELNNVLIGNTGDDVLRGNGGRDFLHGNEGRDTYSYFIGDGDDLIDERFGAGRDFLDIHLFDEYVFDNNGNDPLGGTTLADNFEFLRDGNDLEVRLTLDGLADNGRITVQDMGWGRQRVETLRLFDFAGDQVGPDISLRSIFEFATSTSTAFEITSNTSNYGNLAQPVV